jgi:ERCC4-type nuclease
MPTVQIDTREKQRAIENIIKFFDGAGVNHVSSKCYVGDYLLLENPLFIIDRKQNIAEIAANATNQHGRVKRELERLKQMGGTMVFLIEQKFYIDPKGTRRTINSLEDIMFWENPHGTVNGLQVYKILDAWQHKYNISFQFCDKRTTGRRILEILAEGYEAQKKVAQYEQEND